MASVSNRQAAFFDVDGTIVKTNIIHYYLYFQRRRLPAPWRDVWSAGFAAKCLYFLLLDKIDRTKLNIVFYRHYRGLPVDEIESMVAACHRDVIMPRLFPMAQRCVEQHQDAGRPVVFVTGSVDFIMRPLAQLLGVKHVLAPSLVRHDGRFTGELNGPPLAGAEKARQMRVFADRFDVDLAGSHAYGDSIADLPMLEAVGHAHAVNPERALAKVAKLRGWDALQWDTPRRVGSAWP